MSQTDDIPQAVRDAIDDDPVLTIQDWVDHRDEGGDDE
jgi:hypothetical protein